MTLHTKVNVIDWGLYNRSYNQWWDAVKRGLLAHEIYTYVAIGGLTGVARRELDEASKCSK